MIGHSQKCVFTKKLVVIDTSFFSYAEMKEYPSGTGVLLTLI